MKGLTFTQILCSALTASLIFSVSSTLEAANLDYKPKLAAAVLKDEELANPLRYSYVMADEVNLRAEPTRESVALACLNRGDRVELLSKAFDSGDGPWYKVKTSQGQIGFVSFSYISYSKPQAFNHIVPDTYSQEYTDFDLKCYKNRFKQKPHNLSNELYDFYSVMLADRLLHECAGAPYTTKYIIDNENVYMYLDNRNEVITRSYEENRYLERFYAPTSDKAFLKDYWTLIGFSASYRDANQNSVREYFVRLVPFENDPYGEECRACKKVHKYLPGDTGWTRLSKEEFQAEVSKQWNLTRDNKIKPTPKEANRVRKQFTSEKSYELAEIVDRFAAAANIDIDAAGIKVSKNTILSLYPNIWHYGIVNKHEMPERWTEHNAQCGLLLEGTDKSGNAQNGYSAGFKYYSCDSINGIGVSVYETPYALSEILNLKENYTGYPHLDMTTYFNKYGINVKHLKGNGFTSCGKDMWEIYSAYGNRPVYLVVSSYSTNDGRYGEVNFMMFFDKKAAEAMYEQYNK